MQIPRRSLFYPNGLRFLRGAIFRYSSPTARSITDRATSRLISAMATSRETVHILGLGNLGKFFAHSLAKSNPNTPITLLFHRPSLATEWEKAGRCIEIVTNGIPDRQNGFSVEIIGGTEAKELRAIQNLIVATKTYATAPALMPLKQRLNSDTTLLFLQNGMGIWPSTYSWSMLWYIVWLRLILLVY
jgi:hypothetical protein